MEMMTKLAVCLLTWWSLVLAVTADITPDIKALETITLYGHKERRVPLEMDGKPTNVSISLLIAAINLNQNKMQAEVNFFLRQRWENERLNYTSLSSSNETSDESMWEEPYYILRPDWFNYLWQPDIYIPNAVLVQKFDYPSSTMSGVLYANGTIVSIIRMRAIVNCPVDQYRFLHDSQSCIVRFESFSYPTDKLRLRWLHPDPVDFDEKIKQQRSVTKLSDSDLQDCTNRRFATMHSCLQVTLTLMRTNNIYVTQVYFPSTLTVGLSWLSFWIDREAILARVSLGSLCVVTIMTHATGLVSRLPEQAGIKAIDVWELSCVTLIFCAMLEFATMHAMLRRQQTIKAAQKFVEEYNSNCEKNELGVAEEESLPESAEKHGIKSRKMARKVLRARWWHIAPERIDVAARRLFPIVFVLFNIVYWTVYLF